MAVGPRKKRVDCNLQGKRDFGHLITCCGLLPASSRWCHFQKQFWYKLFLPLEDFKMRFTKSSNLSKIFYSKWEAE